MRVWVSFSGGARARVWVRRVVVQGFMRRKRREMGWKGVGLVVRRWVLWWEGGGRKRDQGM